MRAKKPYPRRDHRHGREANTWLAGDDDMHRKLHHASRGVVAHVLDILEAEIAISEER